jgi:hypothetical protein
MKPEKYYDCSTCGEVLTARQLLSHSHYQQAFDEWFQNRQKARQEDQ